MKNLLLLSVISLTLSFCTSPSSDNTNSSDNKNSSPSDDVIIGLIKEYLKHNRVPQSFDWNCWVDEKYPLNITIVQKANFNTQSQYWPVKIRLQGYWKHATVPERNGPFDETDGFAVSQDDFGQWIIKFIKQ